MKKTRFLIIFYNAVNTKDIHSPSAHVIKILSRRPQTRRALAAQRIFRNFE